MKTLLRTTAMAVLLLVVGATGALAAPGSATLATAPSPADLPWQNLPGVFFQAYQMQQNAVDQLEQARLRQVLALIKAGQPAEVEFAGVLAPAATGGQWTVAGLDLGQTNPAVFEGLVAAGLHAHVHALIHNDGTLETMHVRTLTESDPAPRHAAEWLRDDCGIHLAAGNHTSADDHGPAYQPANGTHHAAEPEHTGPAAQTAPQPADHAHPETPARHAAQPAQHGEGSHGGHASGHD